MTETSRIADQLHRAYAGPAWHGPALTAILADVTAAEASAHPVPGAHSIWELVLHITVWMWVADRRIAGEVIPDLPLDRNFPADVILKTIRECGASLLESVEVFDVYEGTAVAAGKKSVALACRYRAKDRTLTDEEVNRIHAVLVEQARMRLGAELRQ